MFGYYDARNYRLSIYGSMICADKIIILCQHLKMVEITFDRAAVFRLLREKTKKAQGALGFNKGTISDFETRKTRNPNEQTLKILAERLGVSLREIDDAVEILNGRMKPAPLADSTYQISNPDHLFYHRKLDAILNGTDDQAKRIAMAVCESIDAGHETQNPTDSGGSRAISAKTGNDFGRR